MTTRLDNQVFQPMRRGCLPAGYVFSPGGAFVFSPGCSRRQALGCDDATENEPHRGVRGLRNLYDRPYGAENRNVFPNPDLPVWAKNDRPLRGLNTYPAGGRRAFTLVELLVVISTIALVLTITLPGIIGLFTAGADLQARNVISGMLGAARGVAIENQSYALVHVQIDVDGEKCWAAVMEYDKDPSSPSFGKFVPVAGFTPQQMPSDMAFGEITSTYVTDGGNYKSDVNTDLPDFTTFNIIFGPDGGLMTGLINSVPPQIETDESVKIFGGATVTEKQQIWDPAGPTLDEAGVRAITAFHYRTIKAMSDADRLDWLERNGQFLCINQYTGKLLPTK